MMMKSMESPIIDQYYFGSLIDLYGIASINISYKVARRKRCILALISPKCRISMLMRRIASFGVGKDPFRGRYQSSVIAHRKQLIYL